MVDGNYEENFDEYFLRAQKEGHEVYIGEKIALVAYKEERRFGIQKDHYGPPLVEAAVFASYYELDDVLKNDLLEILKPENREGIKKDLTSKIGSLYCSIICSLEGEDLMEQIRKTGLFDENGNINMEKVNYGKKMEIESMQTTFNF